MSAKKGHFEATRLEIQGLNKVVRSLILQRRFAAAALGDDEKRPSGWTARGRVIAEGKSVTRDMKPHRRSDRRGTEMADAIIAKIKAGR